jgi:hypothetical protein
MNDNKNNRRDFLRKAAQLTFLSAMIGGSAYLLSEDRTVVPIINFAKNARN